MQSISYASYFLADKMVNIYCDYIHIKLMYQTANIQLVGQKPYHVGEVFLNLYQASSLSHAHMT